MPFPKSKPEGTTRRGRRSVAPAPCVERAQRVPLSVRGRSLPAMAPIVVIPIVTAPIAMVPIAPSIVVSTAYHDIAAGIVRVARGDDRASPVHTNAEAAPADEDTVGAGGRAGREAEKQRARTRDRRPANDSSLHGSKSPYLKPFGR